MQRAHREKGTRREEYVKGALDVRMLQASVLSGVHKRHEQRLCGSLLRTCSAAVQQQPPCASYCQQLQLDHPAPGSIAAARSFDEGQEGYAASPAYPAVVG